MVRDTIANAALYHALGPDIAQALGFLSRGDQNRLEPGQRHEMGSGLFGTVFDLETRRREDSSWEAHRRYIDVQCVMAGVELMGHAPLETMRAGAYDEAREFLVAEGDGDFFRMAPGSFVIFWPGDAHMPGVAVEGPAPLRKIVIKVPVRG